MVLLQRIQEPRSNFEIGGGAPLVTRYWGGGGRRAEKRFLAFQNKDSFRRLISIFCKQTLVVVLNKTSNNGNILRRRTRDINPCTLGEVLF